MKIATWNVNGIRARAGQVCEFLEREDPDVLCLQELKANIDQVPLECRVTGYHIYWHGSTMKA
jgi:exodeoxyribonuclease-3